MPILGVKRTYDTGDTDFCIIHVESPILSPNDLDSSVGAGYKDEYIERDALERILKEKFNGSAWLDFTPPGSRL